MVLLRKKERETQKTQKLIQADFEAQRGSVMGVGPAAKAQVLHLSSFICNSLIF